MERKQTKEKPTPWNVGQPLTFPVIRANIQRENLEPCMIPSRESFHGKQAKRKKDQSGAGATGTERKY